VRTFDARLATIAGELGLQGVMTYNLVDFQDLSVNLVDPRDPSTW
jgi:hypothetical protein